MNIDVISLIKFGNKERIENLFKKGEIYMNSIKRLREFEKKGIGDEYESSTSIKNITNAKITLEIPDNPILLKTNKIHLHHFLTDPKGNIYSTYAISNLLFKTKSTHRIDRRMVIFGSHCVIIKDVQKFTQNIFSKLTELGLKYSHRLVKYHNYNKNNHDLGFFDKSHLLSYQKEHRIIAWTNNEQPLKFSIGSIEKYAEIYESND
ncbi:MAG: hypothetical protein IIC74_04350, partial [Bacteroidetes bacterium]|nr:hypothetical protein [Bacteroidota bacterium]